jgi:anti-sigma factor RsiW
VLLRRRSLVCRQVVELVTDYLEDALSAAERRRFEAHLKHCPHCTEYVRQMRSTVRLTGQVDAEPMPAELEDEFIALYRRWIAESGTSSG